MKKIVFIVHTEYHLILSLGFIYQKYSNQVFDCYIYQFSPIGGMRLTNVNIPNIPGHYIKYVYNYDNPTKELKEILDEIISANPNELYIFQEGKHWMSYLLKKLHVKGCNISLAPDGAKVYNIFNFGFQYVCRTFFKYLVQNLKIGIYYPVPLVERKYALNKHIDKVLIEDPKFYDNKTNKDIIKFELPQDSNFTILLNKVFTLNDNSFDTKSKHLILFFDIDTKDRSVYDKSRKILIELKNRNPDYQIVVKPHPRSNDFHHYDDIDGVTYLPSNIPAELFISNCTESIILALYSTAMFFRNDSCRFYWTYKLYDQFKDSLHLKNPKKYIKEVETIEEII